MRNERFYLYQYQSWLLLLTSMETMVPTLTILLVAPENVQMEIALVCVVEVVGVGDFCKPRSRILR